MKVSSLFVKLCVFSIALLSLMGSVWTQVNIVTRLEWNAKESANPLEPLQLPVGRVIIAHTAGNDCKTKESCSQEVRNIQNYHIKKHFDDIAYNYLIGNDGNVYEGRGSYQGASVKGYNADSFTIVFIGNYMRQLPSEDALTLAKTFLEKLVKLQKLKKDYKIYAHSQLASTVSPGDALFAEIKTWPQWSNQV